MTLIDLINAVGNGIDGIFTGIGNLFVWIGNIKIAYLIYWSFAGSLLAWAWYKAFEAVYWYAWVPYKARKRDDASFNGRTIDL